MESRQIDEPPKSSPGEQAGVPEKAAHDPGWNDPPLMSYESSSGPVKKGILNKPKRIAFPLDSSLSPSGLAPSPKTGSNPSITSPLPPSSSLQSSVQPPGMPPIHSGQLPIAKSGNSEIDSISKKNSATGVTSSIDANPQEKEQSLESVLAIFNNVLDTINESKDVAEIKKRLGVMAQMWHSNKLEFKVQQQMFLLAEALENGLIIDANEIHKSLVVNYTSQCSTWMAGVRKLVQYASSESSSIVRSTANIGQAQIIVNDDDVTLVAGASDVENLPPKVQHL